MKNTLLFVAGVILIVITVGVSADFRDGVGSGKFRESTVTSAAPNNQGTSDSVHTPIVATVPSVTASVTTHEFTSGTSAVSYNTSETISTAFDLIEFRANYSAASSTQSLRLWIDSGAGSEFDVTLLTSTVSTTATVFRPSRPVPIRAGDFFRANYANANSDTVGFEAITRQP